MDLIYMDAGRRDIGVMHSYEMDLAFGDDENNFECKVPTRYHCCGFGYGLYIEGTEYGGIIDGITSDTKQKEVTYAGRTWHGILGSKIILPLQNGEASTPAVTVKETDSDGDSLIDRYLVISGDANACIQFILDRVGLGSLFATPSASAGITIDAFQFNRYTDAYTGIKKMLDSVGMKMNLVYTNGRVMVSAVKRNNYAKNDEFESAMFGVVVKKTYRTVNHLICLGSGELEERKVVHLYADHYGNISTRQTLFGVDEYVATYDYSSVESEAELIIGGTERLRELWKQDEISIDFDDASAAYDVGDIIGAVENVTGITASAPIVKKIVTIKNGKITIDLQTGEGTGTMDDYSGTYRMVINEDGHLICVYTGAVPPPIYINSDGHMVYVYGEEAPNLHIDESGHLIQTTETE